jgi:Flp pilus assembly protein TadB
MILFALLAAVGVFMFVEAIGPRPVRIRLTQPDRRPLMQRLIDTFFAPITKLVMTAGRADLEEESKDLETKLARAGYPTPFTTPQAVFGYRLFTAVLFAAFAGFFGLIVEIGTGTIPLMLGFAVFGWMVPARVIAGAERQRAEQLTLDGASTLDRLAIYVAAGNALPAAVRSVAERPGGAWVSELRRVSAAYAVGGDFPAALEEAVERSGRLPAIARVCERLRAAYEMGGGGVAEALRRMAQDARIRIRLLITERGYRNAVMMVIPVFFAIIAAIIILIGPGAARIIFTLGE